MGFLIQYLTTAAPYIYGVCGLIAIVQMYRTWRVRLERRQAVFSLEREKALGDLYRIFVSALTLLLVMGATYFVSTTLADAVEPVREEFLIPTPLAVLIPTPTNTPLPVTATPTPAPTRIVADPPPAEGQIAEEAPVIDPPTPQPTPTPEPAPAVAPALCPDGRSVIISPGNGAAVSGVVSIVGTAQHDQFGYYKLEYGGGSGADGFSYFDGGESPVNGGLLGNLNSAGLANGTYTIQLVVVDTTGNYPPPCRVTLQVQN